MKNILSKISWMILSLVPVLSCTKDFEEINTNPNAAQTLTTPGLLLPNIIRTTANRNWDNSFDRFAVAADQVANQFVSTFNDWTRSDTDYFFWSNYDQIKDLNKIIATAEEQELDNYKGIALVLRAWIFQQITDNFGPIPYTEAAKAIDDINFPKYDSQQTVYEGILGELEMANQLMDPSKETVVGDILYKGNILGWKKLANSLRMRILLRQSGRVDPSTAMQTIVNNPQMYPVFTSNADQAALQYLMDLGNQHPSFKGNVSDWSSSSRLSYNMGQILKGMDDPRLAVFAMPTPASSGSPTPEYNGIPNGIANVEEWNGGSSNHSPVGLLWAPEQYAPGFASPTAAQSIIMSYSELQFILAESREKGYIGTGSAETYYLNGVKAQFDYYSSRIPDTFLLPTAAQVIPPASYYTQEKVAYTGTTQEKLEKIYVQKWLSLFLCGGEAWAHWRRTGVPKITPGPNSIGFIPVRYVYPADEQRLNEGNYNEAVSLLGGPDDLTTKVWWDVD